MPIASDLRNASLEDGVISVIDVCFACLAVVIVVGQPRCWQWGVDANPHYPPFPSQLSFLGQPDILDSHSIITDKSTIGIEVAALIELYQLKYCQ